MVLNTKNPIFLSCPRGTMFEGKDATYEIKSFKPVFFVWMVHI